MEINLSADELVSSLMTVNQKEPVCILDSCGVGHLGSHLLIAGVRPVEVVEMVGKGARETLELLDRKLSENLAAVFTISYDFGATLDPASATTKYSSAEPDLFLALFDVLGIHDYDSSRTFLAGDEEAFSKINLLLKRPSLNRESEGTTRQTTANVVSNFTKDEYVAAVERIQEHIRNGDTYQTNLTQQLRCETSSEISAESIYWRLRRDHPAPFAAFLGRPTSTVVSASPERFFRTTRNGYIESSPIKGTRPRGTDEEDDQRLREELLSSGKDRAENTMIVDLVRNDLGRVCEFGSVVVEKLCDLEEHPTLFHLVSTVRGKLRDGVKFSEILRSVFPCGSITGAPKIRTMQIIDEIEDAPRGLSMGTIGVYIPESWDFGDTPVDSVFDLSVAIRTMVVGKDEAVFNVGGGIVIDSVPEKEFEESLLKAQSLLNALGTSYPKNAS
jgi:para-aminobenzoate synthetase component 1